MDRKTDTRHLSAERTAARIQELARAIATESARFELGYAHDDSCLIISVKVKAADSARIVERLARFVKFNGTDLWDT